MGVFTLFLPLLLILTTKLVFIFQIQTIKSVNLQKDVMAEHIILGKDGEEEAVVHLISEGYTILHRNWRSGRKELDIVALKNEEIIVAEVKTRRNTDYANPEEAVNARKIRRIVSATDAYLKFFRFDYPVRFDIITIIGNKDSFIIEHIKEAFYPPIW